MGQQVLRYENFYAEHRELRALFRFDVRYRCRRLHEVLAALGVRTAGARVLDVGFGGGELLRSFPTSCELTGAEVSASAVEAAKRDERFAGHASVAFRQVPEDEPESLPLGPFDIIVSSHALEHMPDDRACLSALRRRLAPGGVLALFVPIEEPDYIRYHVRNYSLQSITERVAQAGFSVRLAEGSLHINGHVWRLLTVPSRRQWPLLGPVVDALRLVSLSALPYPAVRFLDRALDGLGLGARQALVVARSTGD